MNSNEQSKLNDENSYISLMNNRNNSYLNNNIGNIKSLHASVLNKERSSLVGNIEKPTQVKEVIKTEELQYNSQEEIDNTESNKQIIDKIKESNNFDLNLLNDKLEMFMLEHKDNIPLKQEYIFHNFNFNNEKWELDKVISDFILNKLYLWSVESSSSFKFQLPVSIFSEKTIVDYKGYNGVEVEYFEDPSSNRDLSSKQFEDIFFNGSFSVESKVPGLPYIWYITNWIIRGLNNIYKDFEDAIGISFLLIYKLKHRFKFSSSGLGFSINDSFFAIYEAIKQIVMISIGIASFDYKRQENLVIKSLKTEFSREFQRQNPFFNRDIFSFEVKNQIVILSNIFEARWIDISIDIETKLYEDKLSQEDIREQLYKIRINKVLEIIDEAINGRIDSIDNSIFTNEIGGLLKEYFQAHNIVERNTQIKESKLTEIKNEIESEIQNLYDIRSKVQEWKNSKINNIQKEKQTEIENNMNELIINELSQNGIDQPLILYKSKVNYDKIYKDLYEKSIQSNLLKVPSKEYFIPFYYKEPKGSTIIEDGEKRFFKLNDGLYYTLNTSYWFWKIPLFFVRYASFTYNIAIFAYLYIFNHILGLSSFYKDEIINEYVCDPDTGIVSEGLGRKTLKYNLTKLCKSISGNRKKFEESPDDSFFGKNCARIFNIFYNYILKTITAVVVFMIFYPIIILVWSIFWTMIFITCYIWGLFGIIFFTIFNFLIFDIDTPQDSNGLGLIPTIFYTILFKSIIQLLITLFLIISQPIASIMIIFIGLIRLLLRSVYDIFMFIIIWIFAKIPISDSFLAWKISGPGLSRQYYNHIELGDALTLVHAELEKCELLTFKSLIYSVLEDPLNKAIDLQTKFFKYDLKFEPNQELEASIGIYKKILSKQIYERLSLFPSVNNIKFNVEELTTLKISSRDYIRDYITSHRMEYLFDYFKIYKNSWGKLSELILQSAFGPQILESLTDLDYKIEIKREENLDFDEVKVSIIEKSGINNLNFQNEMKNNLNLELINIKICDICDASIDRNLYIEFY